MSKATTIDHLIASYFVQGVCSNKQADIRPWQQRYNVCDFQPRGKAYVRLLALNHPRKGVEAACQHLKTLKRAKWEAKWAPKHEQQITSAPR